eukprot:TRINITY_DN14716_c0_g3_i1.p1 TRINITY_DN14716_c0_g3~~TRINITY_DN14716_c0_g3_i1.p1  ORF type:complete len:652 (+),score=144.70 TRINITY_DN14716_c0_g3_i1:171-1958(+)
MTGAAAMEEMLRTPDLLTPYCSPGDPPYKKGEAVIFGDGMTGTIARAYPWDNKYSVKALGSHAELRGPDGGFVYFTKAELQRSVPLPQAVEVQEPPAKVPRLDDGGQGADAAAAAAAAAAEAAAAAMPRRLEGRVKWFSREKGFGKIEPRGGVGEEVFVHKKRMDGGADGPHAYAMAEGVLVTYEIITVDEKPCATHVQVRGIAPISDFSDMPRDPAQDAAIHNLILSGMQVGTHQVTGHMKVNSEDRYLSRVGMPVSLGENCKKAACSIFGVFDGHSGASCSDFVAVGLEKAIFDCLRHRGVRDQGGKTVTSDVTFKSALLAAFRTTEHNFFQYANKLDGGAASAWATAGSTACTASFYGPDEEGRLRLVTANAGDSRAVLGKRDGRAVRLTDDHTPDVPSERKRIELHGGAVVSAAQGIWRIVLPSRRGSGVAGLSVSRGFGDLEYKQPAPVVSAVPDVVVRTIDLREDSFIILGSDGVWGPVSDEEAVQIVASVLHEGGDNACVQAAQHLADIAHQRENHDDKTVIVVRFGQLPDEPAHRQSANVASASVRMMRPRHVSKSSGDDMFAGLQKPKSDLEDLDDLFASYARDMR